MNFKKLAAWLTLSATAATPLAIAQNPTILQGNYISNVFGNSNFVLNPNAQTSTANVTVSSATVTRSTTTPLVATSEFNITTSTSTGYADWSLRTFDAGMKGQNCEARFSYRGFSVGTTTAQILQGANVVAQLALTPSTDPRIASINFPCGDLSAVTKFRLQQSSASLTGTNEIGGIYVGLATNMANVAQAETVVIANVNAQITIPSLTYTNVPYQSESLDAYGEYNNTTGVFTAKRAGNYFVAASMFWFNSVWNASNIYLNVFKNGSLIVENLRQIPAGTTYHLQESSVSISMNVGDTLYVSAYQSDSANRFITSNSSFSRLSISRFPSSSELVVTPERQNVFGGVRGLANGGTQNVTSAAWTKLTFATTFNRTTYGKAKVETNNDYSVTIENMPVGNYLIQASGAFTAQASASGNTTECFFGIADTAASGPGIATIQTNSTGDATSANQYNSTSGIVGTYTNTSVANRTFFVNAYRGAGGGNCFAFSDANRAAILTVTPLDQPSNSALYVQGPVKAAATGAAIPAGYVGERKYEVVASATNWPVAGTGNWGTLNSVVLPAGVWSCTGTVSILRNGANFTGPTVNYITVNFAEAANSNATYSRSYHQTSFELAITNAFDNVSLPIRPIILRSNGSQIIWPDNVARGTTTLYLNSFLYGWTAGTPQHVNVIECTRLN